MHNNCSQCLQGRSVPCQAVHWHVAHMQPPMANSRLDDLLASCRSVADQEQAVSQDARQVLEVSGTVLQATETSWISVCGQKRLVCRNCFRLTCIQDVVVTLFFFLLLNYDYGSSFLHCYNCFGSYCLL